jgi:hypothetical protein
MRVRALPRSPLVLLRLPLGLPRIVLGLDAHTLLGLKNIDGCFETTWPELFVVRVFMGEPARLGELAPLGRRFLGGTLCLFGRPLLPVLLNLAPLLIVGGGPA